MTVKELMEILANYPEDMPVMVAGYEYGYEDIKSMEMIKVSKTNNKDSQDYMHWVGEYTLDCRGIECMVLEMKG